MRSAGVRTALGKQSPGMRGRSILVRQGLLPLDEVAELSAVSPDALRTRLERAGSVPIPIGERDHLRLEDLGQILAQWNSVDRHDTSDHTQR